jgi:starch phosphorylase
MNAKIAYFSMEIALKSDVPNYAGGLGVLAADIVKSAADLGVPAIGVTLMYHASETPKFAFKPGPDFKKLENTVHMHIEDRNVEIGVWEYIVKGEKGEVPVYFLDTNMPQNKRWDRDILKDLYAMDRYTRLCQESILGIGGMRMLRELGYKDIETFHMNEGHAAFLTLTLLHESDYKDEEAKKLSVFTTHTPVPAGHDRFDYGMVNQVLTQKVPWHIKRLAGESDLNMTLLALNMSRKANAVAKKHAEVCKKMFPNYEFLAITNGVHVQSWIGDAMGEVFDKHMEGWRSEPEKLADALNIPDEEVVEAHKKGKKELIDFINSKPEFFPAPFDEITDDDKFNTETLTITFARRFVPYKRPLLIFSDIERLRALGFNKIQLIFAGPYHAGDKFGIGVDNELIHIGRALRGQVKIAVLSDYKVDISKYLVRGSDIWLNSPLPPMEASGTSGMKAAVNGGINLSILDGWWIEGYEQNSKSGWAFGPQPSDTVQMGQDSKDADSLYNTLKDVADCYYNKKDEWVERMKNAITLGATFNTHRCVKEYMEKMWNL